ncbi:hypothetical protein EVAR_82536_1 [Eumeta japonica]|uniref:Uncharacterized protein n=1 Tax=Eumeta variegata TaxID=151549 RepID=A0A4C1UYD7_EUMVA|nr:hypothetical protein EVAR_82536_1 [Eumeta japonica]
MGATGTTEPGAAVGAAASSLRSEDSTERLIRIVPVRAGASGAPLALTLGGAAQACAGALLLWCGGAALVRAAGAGVGPVRWAGGAALWAGSAAVAAGALAALAGLEAFRIRHTEHHHRYRGGGLERAALALSLVGAACAHAAGALAAAALQRLRTQPDVAPHTFKEEMEAWSPVVASAAVLAAACAQCALSGLCAYVAARRVCPCLRPAPPQPAQTKAQLAAEDLSKRPPAPPPAPPPALPPALPPLVLLPASSATVSAIKLPP